MDNPYIQAAVKHHWIPDIDELWDQFIKFQRNADKIEKPDDPEEILELVHEPFHCIEYTAERWLHTNYPREHTALYNSTGGSFFRPIEEDKTNGE